MKGFANAGIAAIIVIVVVVGAAVALSINSPVQETTDIMGPTGVEGIMVTNGVKHLVSLDKVIGGGPPKDGIPSIDNPKFISASEAVFLEDENLGLGIELNGVKRFYPFNIIVWHEIVNDKIGRTPVAVTYCPLCQSGVAFERTINGQDVEFGTSGKLFNSNLVMYDRLTDSYWYQITGQAIVGELTGMKLEKIPIETVKWGNWRTAHPDTEVLSTDTGILRNYNVDPYGDYYTSTRIIVPVDNMDNRLHPKAFGYAVDIGESFKFYPRDEVAKVGFVNDNLGGKDILVVQETSTEAIRIFDRSFSGEILIFNIQDGQLLDNTGRLWSFKGQILGGGQLEQIIRVDLFWFSWVADHPDTELFSA